KAARKGIARAASLLNARREHLVREFNLVLTEPSDAMRKVLMRAAFDSSTKYPSARPAAAQVDSAFQRALADAQEEVDKLDHDALAADDSLNRFASAIKGLQPARTARQINQQSGAWMADELKIASGKIDSAALIRLNEPRLPAAIKNRSWMAFTDSEGQV